VSPAGEANWCSQQLEACENFRKSLAQFGHHVNDCTPHASVFCFSSTGEMPLRCSANLGICREQHDRLVANPSHGTATSNCVEYDAKQQQTANAAPPPDEHAWWCVAEPAGGVDVCNRQLSTCRVYREGMSQMGHKMSECTGRASAFCFTHRQRSGSGLGLAHLQCATTLAVCRGFRDVVRTDPRETADTEVLGDCTEQR